MSSNQNQAVVKSIIIDNIPQALRSINNWINWKVVSRNGRDIKLPIDARTNNVARVNDQSSWTSFDAAFDNAKKNRSLGLSFVLTSDLGFVGFDFDKCVDSYGKIQDDISAILGRLNTYTEYSPSGEGLHAWAYGNLPPSGRRTGQIEMYNDVRALTITGHRNQDYPDEIMDRHDIILDLHRELFPPKGANVWGAPRVPLLESDDEILRRMWANRNASKIRGLWDGAEDENGGRSDGDLSLCIHLAFWFNRDAVAIDRVFRQSGRMRPKWDESRGELTYGQITIAEASRRTTRIRGDLTQPPPLRMLHDDATNSQMPEDGAPLNNVFLTGHGVWTDGLSHDSAPEALDERLNILLRRREWLSKPFQNKLYEFLGWCWAHPQLQAQIIDKLKFLSKAEKKTIVGCIKEFSQEHHSEDGGEDSRKHREVSETRIGFDGENYNLQRNRDGRVMETFNNYVALLMSEEHWHSRLRFDLFRDQALLDGMVVTEGMRDEMLRWFGVAEQFSGNMNRVFERAVRYAASRNSFDSLQDHLSRLDPWDGVERLSGWLAECGGAAETPYESWVGTMLIHELVARAFRPGCIARNVVIFEGPENAGKSTAIATLGGDMAITFDMSMDSKEAHMTIRGVWVAELAELATLGRTGEHRLKSFLTLRKEDYIPKFSNDRVTYPRRTVFIGTTNEENYLKGDTGNTRFFPVCTGSWDIERLQQCRDQLFAESLATFRENPDFRWWEEPAEVTGMLDDVRKSRQEINEYVDELSAWLNGQKGQTTKFKTTWGEVARDFLLLDKPADWKDRARQMQIGSAFRQLGWERKRIKNIWTWVRPEQTPF